MKPTGGNRGNREANVLCFLCFLLFDLLGRVDNQVSQNSRAATCRNPRKFTAVFS
jgi:hypothetical protein